MNGSWSPRCYIRDKKYNLARRALRIAGKNEDQMWNAVRSFIHETPRVSSSEVDDTKIESIRIIRSGRPGGIIWDKAVVVFFDPDIRDLVSGHARNFSVMVDANRKPTAGIRTEVPYHLKAVFKMLNDHGRMLSSTT